MPLAFTQTEIERELADTVPHGRRREIARLTAIYESVFDAYYNPHDERKSPGFNLLLIQAALDEVDPEMGDKHWSAMCRLRELSKPGGALSDVEQSDLECKVIDEWTDVLKWFARFDIPKASRRELVMFVTDCGEAENVIGEAKAQATARIKLLGVEQNGNGKPVSYETRDIVRSHPAVEARKTKRG